MFMQYSIEQVIDSKVTIVTNISTIYHQNTFDAKFLRFKINKNYLFVKSVIVNKTAVDVII